MTGEKWDLPKPFQLTSELLAAADAQQKIWASEVNQPFARLSPSARARGRAALIAADVSATPADRADAYATIGRFDEAAAVCADEALFAEYTELWTVMIKDDNEWCNHPKSFQYVERDVYSIRHESDAHLLRCNQCGFRNLVAVLPEPIADLRRKRMESREKMRGMAPLEAKQLFGRNSGG
jgi:hypothetical protein